MNWDIAINNMRLAPMNYSMWWVNSVLDKSCSPIGAEWDPTSARSLGMLGMGWPTSNNTYEKCWFLPWFGMGLAHQTWLKLAGAPSSIGAFLRQADLKQPLELESFQEPAMERGQSLGPCFVSNMRPSRLGFSFVIHTFSDRMFQMRSTLDEVISLALTCCKECSEQEKYTGDVTQSQCRFYWNEQVPLAGLINLKSKDSGTLWSNG